MRLKTLQNKTSRFQNKTLLGLILLLVMLPLLSYGAVPSANGREGIVVLKGAPQWDSVSYRVAEQIERRLRRKGHQVELVAVRASGEKLKEPRGLRPETASGALKEAWEAYYAMRFREGLQRLEGQRDAAAQVLRALILFAQGKGPKAQAVLEQLREQGSQLRLPGDVYPPRFVRFFEEAVEDVPLPRIEGENWSEIKRQARLYARQRDWQVIWLLRTESVGWNGRTALYRVSVRTAQSDEMAQVELEKGAKPSRAAESLLREISHH